MIKTIIAILILVVPTVVHAGRIDEEQLDGVRSEEKYYTLDSLYRLYQPYMSNISGYQPIYFIVGTEPEKSKFQFSFKYCFFNQEGSLARNHPWVRGLHFGYTQTSFWNLKDDSLPFEDTSYKPELFHLTRNLFSNQTWLQGFFLQSGVQHESNGQAEPLSRSTNIIYVRPMFIHYSDKTKLGIGVAPKIWVYFDNSSDNPDLKDYRGNFELNITLGKADSVVLSSSFRLAKEGGSVQLDLSYPIGHYISNNINVYLHVQYANALAENLINYRDRVEALRIGISFIR